MIYQMMNLIMAVMLLGTPVVIAVILFRHFNRKDELMELEARLQAQIQELEERIDKLQEG